MGFYQTVAQRSGIQIILQTIKEYGPISQRELQARTGLSMGHISQVTKRFLEEGLIVVCEKEMTPGRSRELLDINGDNNYFIGVDLNSQRVRAVLTDMKGRVVTEIRKAFEEYERESVLDTIYGVLDNIITQYKEKKIHGIGFAVQGIVDVSKGVSVRIDEIKNWKNVQLKEIVEERYHIKTVIAHDPDCLMKCECNLGALKKSQVTDAVLINYHHGVGVGMSIMINGQIYIGHQGMAGEIGYAIMNTQKGGEPEMLAHYAGKGNIEENVPILIDYLGSSIATVNSLFNPEIVILCIIEDFYREEIVRAVETYLRNYSYNKQVQLEVSRLNKNSRAVGAAFIVVDEEIDAIV